MCCHTGMTSANKSEARGSVGCGECLPCFHDDQGGRPQPRDTQQQAELSIRDCVRVCRGQFGRGRTKQSRTPHPLSPVTDSRREPHNGALGDGRPRLRRGSHTEAPRPQGESALPPPPPSSRVFWQMLSAGKSFVFGSLSGAGGLWLAKLHAKVSSESVQDASAVLMPLPGSKSHTKEARLWKTEAGSSV